MTMRPVVRAVLRGALRDIRHVAAVPPGRARGEVARVYEQAQRDFGVLAPPLALHSAAPGPLAASWMLLRETLLVEGRVDRAVKETVATEVSRANSCPYCVEIHQATLEALPQTGESAATGAVERWIRAAAEGQEPGPAPFTADEAPEILGVALTFHYLNRMVGIFLEDSPLPERTPAAARGTILRTVARTMRPVAGPPVAGAALDLLPDAPLPAGLEWSGPAPAVAGALARSSAAVADAARWVPHPVQDLLATHLAAWDGTPMGIAGTWLDEALTPLTPQHRPAARLALLTAFAAYRVTDQDITAVREHHPSDREIVELTSWASLTTALHLTTRLGAAVTTTPRT
ncbi:carboxymuconolactone decarboxylase family protein [Streptomyces sp. H34-S4]|uniref:carboxymuconolactone decarboxylase family protein n=1 Tax=Streptomyces sp. H34-S4 TaxID=2996463 RepID=UPI002D1E34E9|nr:carboxymuconolactone decarboxylase family protein [Streptomyces sp. H34-S4]